MPYVIFLGFFESKEQGAKKEVFEGALTLAI